MKFYSLVFEHDDSEATVFVASLVSILISLRSSRCSRNVCNLQL